MSFVINQYLDYGVINPYYNLIRKNKLIYTNEYGWFIISKVDEEISEMTHKTVTCYSYEYVFTHKTVNLLNGTYKLYDELNPSNPETVLGKILEMYPSWKIGDVDKEFFNLYRTFDVPDTTVYGFLFNDVAKAYKCFFKFDTDNKIINVLSSKSIVKDTSIVVTDRNLLKSVNINQNGDDIITAVAVYGGGSLDIRNVNPLGTAFIYNFDYYKNSEWMEEELIEHLELWEKKVSDNTPIYAAALSSLKIKHDELLGLEIGLADLKGQLKALEEVRLSQGTDILPETSTAIDNKNIEIKTKETEIADKKAEITAVETQLSDINKNLSFGENFTNEELIELDALIFEGNFTNENYIKTDIMTESEVIDMTLELLEEGKRMLKKVSQPIYTFSMTALNFVFLNEYLDFANQLDLGSKINVEVRKGEWVEPVVLQIDMDYDNPTNLEMTFSNRFRLDTAEWTFAEMFHETSRASSSVKANADIWSKPVKSGIIDSVSEYMNNAFDLSKQEIVSSKNQQFTIGEYGIRGAKYNEDGSVDPRQIWINNNMICVTDDGWQTSKLAIGNINGKMTVNAEILAGVLIMGNELRLTNKNGDFVFDEAGAKLTNATLMMNNNKNRITMLPTIDDKNNNIFMIEENISQTEEAKWKKVLWLDTNGKLNFSGSIIADSGKIGGWTINDKGISSANGVHYLNSDGTFRLGNFTYDDVKKLGKFEGGEIVGSSINVGNGNFTVDTSGHVTAKSIHLGEDITFDAPVIEYQYSSDNSNWHNGEQSGDKYRREKQVGQSTWGNGYMYKGQNGQNGANGSDGDPEGFLRSIKITKIGSGSIQSAQISGALIEGGELKVDGGIGTLGNAKSELGIYGLDDKGGRVKYGYIRYDGNGAGTETEAQRRMFICTVNGQALKIKSDADISIGANGTLYIDAPVKFKKAVEGLESVAVFG